MLSWLKKYFTVLPILYLFIAVFILRDNVQHIYIISLLLVALTAIAVRRSKGMKDLAKLSYWMLTLASIGLAAATILSVEKVELLSNPNHITSCSLSPVVSCSPIITSAQASAFTIPNPFIGIFGFACVLAAAMTLLAGAQKLNKVWWRTLLGSISFGAAFCAWLFYQGVFVIGKLCLYCMLVWLVTYTLLWLVTAYCVKNKYISLGKRLNKLLSYTPELISVTYTAIFMLIIYRWSDYWFSLL